MLEHLCQLLGTVKKKYQDGNVNLGFFHVRLSAFAFFTTNICKICGFTQEEDMETENKIVTLGVFYLIYVMHASKVIAILLAGGSGSRFGSDCPKQFLEVNGKTILEHSICAFHRSTLIDEIVIVTRKDFVQEVRHIASIYPKVSHVCPGGKERYHSTLSALEVCTDDNDLLLIHDAVRPMVSEAIISRCVAALQDYDAIGVAIPSTDTIVRVDQEGRIVETLPRTLLRNMQTPQGFRRGVLRKAFDIGLQDENFSPTDDCGVVRKYLPEIPVRIVEGDARNIKITYPSDLAMFAQE